MSTPALVFLALWLLEIGVVLAKNGQPKEGQYSLCLTLVSAAIFCGVAYWGGFFDKVTP